MSKLLRIASILIMTLILAPWLAFADTSEDTSSTESSSSDSSSSSSSSSYSTILYTSTDTNSYTSYGNSNPIMTCQFSGFSTIIYDKVDDKDADLNEETRLIQETSKAFEDAFAAKLSPDDEDKSNDRCGIEEHPVTGALEQADCAREGQVVTVIAESFAGTTALGNETDGYEARVVNVYRDICCMVIKEIHTEVTNDAGEKETITTYECKDQRTLYYTEETGCKNSDSPYCEKRQWVIGETGASIIKIYVKQIYIWAAGIIGFVAVITIVLNGIRISVSGVSGDITEAKDRIIQAISGLVLLFLSGLILYTINPTFFS